MSDNVVCRQATDSDYRAMLRLQEENLRVNLSDAEAADGFLSRRYAEAQFRRVNRELGVAVATAGSEVVGYLCAKRFSYAVEFPVLKSLIEHMNGMEINGVTVHAETSFIYGPVCVSRLFRGTGVLAGLWSTMQKIVTPHDRIAILFIADANHRSMRAHLKLGMRHCGDFIHEGKRFHALAATVT